MRAVNRRMFRLNAHQHEQARAHARAIVGPEPEIAPMPEPTPLTRGGTPEHPGWFRVMALVKASDGSVNLDFVVETPVLATAMLAASLYHYRAIVTDCHSKRCFDNLKPIEVIAPPVEAQCLDGDGEGRR